MAVKLEKKALMKHETDNLPTQVHSYVVDLSIRDHSWHNLNSFLKLNKHVYVITSHTI